jgi:hypothetical protein
MNRLLGWRLGVLGLASALLLSAITSAQQKAQTSSRSNSAYDLRREVSLEGTVVSFTENSSIPPLGAHVSIQTSSGVVDVHLGDAGLLQANHFTLATGDSVRIVGESLPYGSGMQFFSRIIQKGNQALALRSTRGFPLRPVPKAGKAEAGVL